MGIDRAQVQVGTFCPSKCRWIASCQAPTAKPLDGCPDGTLLVGPSSQFRTVQSAILSLPNNTHPYTILIQPGNYTEQVNITRPGPVTLLGVTSQPNSATNNLVKIIWHNATGTPSTGTYDNLFTSVLTVAPSQNASATGSGPSGTPVTPGTPFGNTDFRAYNIDLINAYLPYSAGPSLALSVSYANAGLYYCGIYSYQDTIYIGKLGSSYISNSIVGGQTDFLYGFGTLWIQSSTLQLRGCGGGITAWKGTNTTFVNHYGAYIHDSCVEKANSTLNITKQCALGRPWNAGHRSIFANCDLDDSIRDSGYIQWSATDPRLGPNLTMAEYHDYGAGFNLTGRLAANITKLLTPAQYAPYDTPAKVFEYPFTGKFGNTAWIDDKPSA
ncbi:carbohydrate esterase family 8 protein [Myriangium duriaei CBS 260.36]|uniref:pectinesterase n=1 Tax=Myriangium duriaei CBS 260.36 TaxID=1168546 RepID=A0A9P4MGN6_9PEZI|nr:carbohydrate esterase family 8 protein [Myriangium duriaei CBS 260.36]